jgi:SAM-dependent methyltransferase
MPRGTRLSRSLYLRPSSRRRPEADEGAPLPPKRLRFMGESDPGFVALGNQVVDLLREHADLGRDSRVLDIGCGYGRLPHALRRHGFAGEYVGIDVLKRPVRWCERRLGDDRFRFRHVDLRNDRYNPKGELTVSELDLGDERFDVIAAFSVFTHMWPEDVDAYLRTIARALAPGGRAAATFFLLDAEPQKLAAADRVAVTMPFEREAGCRYQSEENPLHRVGYETGWVVGRAAVASLWPATPPVYGTWSLRPIDPSRQPSYQDLVVFRRLEEVAE